MAQIRIGGEGLDIGTDILWLKNIRAYVKALSSDADTRHLLSTEFQGLLEAARKARASMGEPKQLPASENDE